MKELNLAKYEDYRLSSVYIKDGQLVRGTCIEGQRRTDLNWEIIKICECRSEAFMLIWKICRATGKHMFYNEAGYGIDMDAE